MSNIELWTEIIQTFEELEQYLNKTLLSTPNADWEKFVPYISKSREHVISFSHKCSTTVSCYESVIMTAGCIQGLNRYFNEFYWDSNVEKQVSNYLFKLAELRVKLLDHYEY